MPRQLREIGSDLLGQTALDPFYGTTSAARGAMFTNHIGQAPIPKDNEPRRIMAGPELRYSQNTFDIRFPTDCTVLHVIRKYPTGMGADSIHHNPLITIIYEEYYDLHKRIGVIQVPEFNSLHQDFGYDYVKRNNVMERLVPGENFSKDEVIACSPAVRENGQYGLGLQASCVFISDPGTIEDGFVMSESFLKRMTPKVFNKFKGSSGRKQFFLNMYGDDNVYKPFPDIGQRIRDDGVIFATRDLDDNLSIADMTPRALRTVDMQFDKPTIGKPGALVKDITVYHDNRTNPVFTPAGMDYQLRKYYNSASAYYNELLNIYNKMRQRRGKDKDGNWLIRITPEFNQLLVEAQIYLPVPDNQRKLSRMFRLEALDEWMVEVTCEAEMDPDNGYKATDGHGGKGVICKVKPDHHMPMDSKGNRAEVAIYGGSTMRRLNFGRLYEQFINAAARDLVHRLRESAGMLPNVKPTQVMVQNLRRSPEVVDNIFETLMRFYEIVAPLQKDMLVNDPDRYRHVASVLMDGHYLFIPPNNPVDLIAMGNELANGEFRPHYGPVTYTNSAGQHVTTRKSVLIGDLYMFCLEKIGDDWSGVASTKTQQFGLPAKLNNSDKLSTPGREQPVRSMGESETRSYICVVGAHWTNELLDQTTNPMAHNFGVDNIVSAAKPTNIPKLVDRNVIPYGGSRPVGLYQHLLECRGLKFVYKPDV
jgi:hypothetical protein